MPATLDIDCGDPGTPTSGQRHSFSTVYTSEVLYFCFMGYTLQGSDRRTCLSSGQWSGHLPECNRMFIKPVIKKEMRWYFDCGGAGSLSSRSDSVEE